MTNKKRNLGTVSFVVSERGQLISFGNSSRVKYNTTVPIKKMGFL